jgi:hypothetical protein
MYNIENSFYAKIFKAIKKCMYNMKHPELTNRGGDLVIY